MNHVTTLGATDMRHIVMDTETTGLILNTGKSLSRQPRVTEICAFIYNDKGKILEGFDGLFRLPEGEKLSEEAVSYTHLRAHET